MKPIIPESFVQFVWKFSLFSMQNLQLKNGETLQIVHPGTQNFAGGPDFLNAKLYIDHTLWVGNIEIHVSVKQWKEHKHFLDPAYNNLILHVVFYDENEDIYLENGRTVPTLSLHNRIFPTTFENFKRISQQKTQIPCENLIHQLDTITLVSSIESLLIERLERKVVQIEEELALQNGDLEGAFLVKLFSYFGAPQNKDTFELLARSFSLTQLSKQQVSVLQMEAFLFGLSGLLVQQDTYAIQLKNQFSYLQKLYKLKVYVQSKQWNFAGVRPINFPTIRIAQLAALLQNNVRWFSILLEAKSIQDFYEVFKISVSSYWLTHYNFGLESTFNKKLTSKPFINKLIINVFVPFLFYYGKSINDEYYKDTALAFLEQIQAEENQIVQSFNNLGIVSNNSFESQALIELHNEYCKQKKCLECRIGFYLLK